MSKLKLSKDYARLFDIVDKGDKIAAYVDYKFHDDDKECGRDICQVKKQYWGDNFLYVFGVRGMCYSEVRDHEASEKQTMKGMFLAECERMNLEWIDSRAPDGYHIVAIDQEQEARDMLDDHNEKVRSKEPRKGTTIQAY